jgi:septal ring factor EnvC (AmiA/AmiB activator)
VPQLEEALAETKATAARQESSLEASATKLKSLEKQLAEARDSLTAGSSAKEKEGEEKRKELVDARAKCTKVSTWSKACVPAIVTSERQVVRLSDGLRY